jgi:outer membrane biosynthesis protein TonB
VQPLGFSARSQEGKLLLTWNADSGAVRNARRAVLSITDGSREEDVDLSLAAVRGGALVYAPVTQDVTLQLRVSSDGAADTVESVRAAGLQESAVPPVAVDVAGPQPISVGDVGPVPTPTRNPRLFAPPTSAPHSASDLNVSEPPAIEAEARPAPGTLELAPGHLSAPAPPPAAATPAVRRDPAPAILAPAAPATQPAAGPLRVGSLRVLRRTVIPHPPFARQAHVYGTVTVEVRIGEDGRVREAAAIRGPEMLRWTAAKGVKDWLFETPAVDGKRVEAITLVDVTFKP